MFEIYCKDLNRYPFENIPIEVHPVLKENKHRPIKEVELDEPPTHPILTFFKWLFFFFFIVFLIIGIVLLILMILNKGKGKDDKTKSKEPKISMHKKIMLTLCNERNINAI